MATIHNDIQIAASAKQVWDVLANISALDRYDPVVHKSVVVGDQDRGIGAKRRCDTDAGYFIESITVWDPEKHLEFRISECTLPMKDLTHTYRLEENGGTTHVYQTMKYTMKFGLVGKLMDALMGKRHADKQIKLFFNGLKKFVETGEGKT